MSVPIVTLDKIYIEPDEKNIYFLDCTRINGSTEIISRKRESLDLRIYNLAKVLRGKEIILADDVVFSGSVLRNIINRFELLGVKVVGVVSAVCTNTSYDYFNLSLKYGIRSNYVMDESVIDQICERDFYFGIAGSGIVMSMNGELLKAPYFKPYGEPCERASIPKEYEDYFSKGCLERSKYLWEEIDKLKNIKTLISQLPEKIINTNDNEEVVNTLKKELNGI